MNTEFSKTAFERAVDREALRSRLAGEIARRVHGVASRELETIIAELRNLGHDAELSAKYDPEFAAWHWSADHPKQVSDDPRLRFYYDSQVSCWYD